MDKFSDVPTEAVAHWLVSNENLYELALKVYPNVELLKAKLEYFIKTADYEEIFKTFEADHENV